MSKELVCVVIPLYKNTLTHFERISLNQCLKILKNYPICFVKPHSLNIDELLIDKNIKVEDFADDYFESVQSYNRLMLSEEFYKRFLTYEYMLIHQLDAYVFRDELADWCNQDYDYIGAPWRIEIDFDSKIKEFIWNLKKKIALWFDLKENLYGKYGPKEIIFKRSVGNGGFSLRRVEKFLNLIPKHQKSIEKYLELAQTHPAYNEDAFWCIELNRFVNRLRIPDWRIALKFAVEHLPEKAYKINGGLPFGCHAWDIYETDFWKKYIKIDNE
jgi:hypothetical protein